MEVGAKLESQAFFAVRLRSDPGSVLTARKGCWSSIKFNFKRAGPPVLSRVGGRKPSSRMFEPCIRVEVTDAERRKFQGFGDGRSAGQLSLPTTGS